MSLTSYHHLTPCPHAPAPPRPRATAPPAGFFAVEDPFLAYPNGLGAILGCVQCILCVVLPRTVEKKARAKSKSKSGGGSGTAVSAAVEMGLTSAESDLDGEMVAIGGAPAPTSTI